MANDGIAEGEWMLAALANLCEGQVWQDAVPDDVQLKKFAGDERLKPYIILSVAEPFSSDRDRGLCVDEDKQPHVMSSFVKVFGGEVESVKASMREVRARLVGKSPSNGATQLRVTGGGSFPTQNPSVGPSRFCHVLYLRCTVNLADTPSPTP